MKFVQKLTDRIPASVKEKAPEILMGVGTGAVVGGTALIAYESTKLGDIIAKYKEEKAAAETDGDRRKATAKLIGKTALNYLPGVAVEAAGLGLMWNGFGIRTRAYIGMGAAYASLKTAYDGLEQAIRDEYGEDAASKLIYGAKEETTIVQDENGDAHTESQLVYPAEMPSPYARYFAYGESSEASQSFEYNDAYLRGVASGFAGNYLMFNRILELNTLYKVLGYKPSNKCRGIGWIYDIADPERHNVVDLRIRVVYRVKYDDFGNAVGTEKVHLIDPNVDGPISRDAIKKGLMDE